MLYNLRDGESYSPYYQALVIDLSLGINRWIFSAGLQRGLAMFLKNDKQIPVKDWPLEFLLATSQLDYKIKTNGYFSSAVKIGIGYGEYNFRKNQRDRKSLDHKAIWGRV